MNLAETGTFTLPPPSANGVVERENGANFGATFAMVAVVRAVSTPPRPSSTATMTLYEPLSA